MLLKPAPKPEQTTSGPSLRPQTDLGWWALWLLLLAALVPLWGPLLASVVADGVAVTLVVALSTVVPLALAGVAVFRDGDRSMFLIALANLVLLVALVSLVVAGAMLLGW